MPRLVGVSQKWYVLIWERRKYFSHLAKSTFGHGTAVTLFPQVPHYILIWPFNQIIGMVYQVKLSRFFLNTLQLNWIRLATGSHNLICLACSHQPLQWRHNVRNGVSNPQPHDCLLNRFFRRRSKKTSKLRVTGLCAENSPVTGEFPAQMASNAVIVSIWNYPDI